MMRVKRVILWGVVTPKNILFKVLQLLLSQCKLMESLFVLGTCHSLTYLPSPSMCSHWLHFCLQVDFLYNHFPCKMYIVCSHEHRVRLPEVNVSEVEPTQRFFYQLYVSLLLLQRERICDMVCSLYLRPGQQRSEKMKAPSSPSLVNHKSIRIFAGYWRTWARDRG